MKTRTVNIESKKFKVAAEKYLAAILEVLTRYNALETKDGNYDYVLNTPAGPLRVLYSITGIFQCFDDVESGSFASRVISSECSPWSGKWNFWTTHREILDDPIQAMKYWETSINKLMSIPYGWQPFKERLEAWKQLNSSTGTDLVSAVRSPSYVETLHTLLINAEDTENILKEVRIRVSDLGSMLSQVDKAKNDVQSTGCHTIDMLFNRLWAIRKIVG